MKDRLTRLVSSIISAIKHHESEKEKAAIFQQLKSSVTQYRELVERIADGFLSVDNDWQITFINNIAAEMFGRTSADLLGKSIRDEYTVLKEGPFYSAYEKVIATGQPMILEDYSVVLKRWMQVSYHPSSSGVSIFLRDISAQRLAEIEAKESETKYSQRIAAILNTLPANIVLLDATGKIMEINESWKSFAQENGFDGEAYGLGRNYISVCNNCAGMSEEIANIVHSGINTVLSNNIERFEYDYDYYASGIHRWARVVAAGVSSGGVIGVVVMHLDISEIKLLQEEKEKRTAEEQRKITAAVLEAQQRERDIIGRELHDNINQILVGTNLTLSTIHTEDFTVEKVVRSAIENLQEAIRETRKLAHELVSPDFSIKTLTIRIKNIFSNMLSSNKIEINISHDTFNEALLTEEQKFAIFRISQEHCTNIVKHAQPSKVDVDLAMDAYSCRFSIADNGNGMLFTDISAGIGMKNIAARMTVLNGHVHIQTSSGNGFELVTEFPLRR